MYFTAQEAVPAFQAEALMPVQQYVGAACHHFGHRRELAPGEASALEPLLSVRDAQGHHVPASAEQILEAARQVVERKMLRGEQFTSIAMASDYVRAKLGGFDHEVFAVLFFDSHLRFLDYAEMFRGTIHETSVYPREVVRRALHLNASSVILAHNHPSGDPAPSHADRSLTQRLKSALGLVEVQTLDHIVVGGNRTASFSELGLI